MSSGNISIYVFARILIFVFTVIANAILTPISKPTNTSNTGGNGNHAFQINCVQFKMLVGCVHCNDGQTISRGSPIVRITTNWLAINFCIIFKKTWRTKILALNRKMSLTFLLLILSVSFSVTHSHSYIHYNCVYCGLYVDDDTRSCLCYCATL